LGAGLVGSSSSGCRPASIARERPGGIAGSEGERLMAIASIPVDLFNPGQVFACFGFLETAEVLLGDAEGGFDWGDAASPRFTLRVQGISDSVESVLRFLSKAMVYSFAPVSSDLTTAKWTVPTRKQPLQQAFPFPLPASPATLPVVLEGPFNE